MQQASCLEGGPLLWIWPLYLHVNQKSDDDDDDDLAIKYGNTPRKSMEMYLPIETSNRSSGDIHSKEDYDSIFGNRSYGNILMVTYILTMVTYLEPRAMDVDPKLVQAS